MKKLSLIIFFILLDQISKLLAMKSFEIPYEIFDFFSLKFVQNEGIAFSLPVAQYIVIPLSFLFLGWLGWQIYNYQLSINNKQLAKSSKNLVANHYSLSTIYAYVLIFSGALGNLLDRLIYGKVTDFLSFWNFPVFNLADTWITIGIILFIWGEFKGHENTKEVPPLERGG